MKYTFIALLSIFFISCAKKEVSGKITGRIMISCGNPAVNTTFSLFKQKESTYKAYRYFKVKDFQTDSTGYFEVDYQTKDVRTMIIAMENDIFLPSGSLVFDLPIGGVVNVGDLLYKNQTLDFILQLNVNQPYTSSDTLYIQSDNIFPTYKLAGPFTQNFMDTLSLYTFTPNRKYKSQSNFTVTVSLNSTKLMTDHKVSVTNFCSLIPPYNDRYLQVTLP